MADGGGREGELINQQLLNSREFNIMILEGGRIREYGEYAALENDPNSRFSSLLRTGLEEMLA